MLTMFLKPAYGLFEHPVAVVRGKWGSIQPGPQPIFGRPGWSQGGKVVEAQSGIRGSNVCRRRCRLAR